ncbi:MAG: amidase [Anaerolineae bacterium]|nr:amidase [Anaerolineae bacterium]MCB9105633.1 amidase [Anaerolineales bacterium]
MSPSFETQLASLAQSLRSGNLTLTDYLARLEAYFDEKNEPVQAFLPEENRFDRLRQEAAALEAQYPEPSARPPLYGVPIGVKDIFHVNGFKTQAGSKLPADSLTGPEAESVTRLKQMGALVLGKTVTTEFAYFAPGATRNPHNLEHTPGGSSSGSAAAVAAHLCPLTLGTQTVGSVVRPASFCGVVGFKPTSGRISTAGVIPLSPTLDHVGVFTQDVAGAALAASILCADWQVVAPTDERPRLGIPTGPYLDRVGTEGLAHFQKTASKLTQAGFTVQSMAVMPDFDQIYEAHMALMAAEAAVVHQDWFGQFGDRYRPKTADLIKRGQNVSPTLIEAARTSRENLRDNLQTLMTEHNIDLWISPAAVGTAPAGLDGTGDPVMNLPWTFAGLPALNLPSGFGENGLPLGLQLSGGWYTDEQMLAWAEQIAELVK